MKPHSLNIKLITLCLIAWAVGPVGCLYAENFQAVQRFSAPPDSLPQASDSLPKRQNHKGFLVHPGYPKPSRALIYSAILPGLGQAYNHKYWKVPVVYAALGTMYYFISFNQTEYDKFQTAYEIRYDGDPATVDAYSGISDNVILNQRDYYRQNLQWSYVGMGLTYLLQAMEAFVNAHLSSFDVSENLTLSIRPGCLPANRPLGVSLTLSAR